MYVLTITDITIASSKGRNVRSRVNILYFTRKEVG